MALRYYPLTRILPNRYTRGGEFVLANGTPYTGRYYTLYTGESFTGINPILGKSERLYPASSRRLRAGINRDANLRDFRDANLIQGYSGQDLPVDTIVDGIPTLTELKPYYPFPLESDYQRGYFQRYFAKNITGPGYIFEISKLDWTKIQNGDVGQNTLGYETGNILWQLTGPLRDTRISQYQIKGGVFDTNKRVTEGEDKTFRGLIAFIGGDYTKFARITP